MVDTTSPGQPQGQGPTYRPGYELIAERILELVVREQLRPGDFLGTETQLTERLGTSRTVVREAVKVLTAVGRLRSLKGKGLYVANHEGFGGDLGFFLPADIAQVQMLFEFRKVQERAAARLAATRATPQEVRALRDAATENLRAAESADAAAFSQTDDRFHQALATASHNAFLAASIALSRRLHDQASLIGLRATLAGSREHAADEHRRIAEAVAAGDPDAAERVVGEHIDGTLEAYEAKLMEFARQDRRETRT